MQLEEDHQKSHIPWPTITSHNQPCCTPHTQGLSGKRKTAAVQVNFEESSTPINGTKAQKSLNYLIQSHTFPNTVDPLYP